MTTATLDTTAHKKQRAALQARLKDRELAKSRNLRAVEELKMAEALVSKGERTRVYLEPFERARDAGARELGAIDNNLPGELLNSCRDRDLKDQFEVAMSLRSVAQADHARATQTLKSKENSLAILQSGITKLIGAPSIGTEGQSMPWDSGIIAKTFSAVQIAFGQTTSAKWAISADRQSVSFGPSVTASNADHYADGWHLQLRDIKLAQVSVDETARRLADAQAAFAEVKTAMIWSPV